MKKEIAELRRDYQLQSLDESHAASDAIEQFTQWWQEALKSEIAEVNAMTLATAGKDAKPHARIVLLKDFDERGFVFFTNFESNKGKEIQENPFAALIFFWKELERQIRIEGSVEKIEEKDSDTYFDSRPLGSRISAWASPQSSIVPDRKFLDENVRLFTNEFFNLVKRPVYWGGYRVKPAVLEFWQGRANRLHDRLLYTRCENDKWKIERLAP